MKKLIILGILSFYFSFAFSQEQEEEHVPYSSAISAHIKKYNIKIDEAFKLNDLERAKFLFDSLVNNHLKGTYMDNFNVNTLKGNPISLKEYEKPIFLTTSAAWCVTGVGEIPAFNDLVDKFHDQIDFIVLFWDSKENLKAKAKEYSSNTQLVYVDEKTNQDSYVINKLKHALGFPMTYFISHDKKILDIRKTITHHSSETLSNSYNIHFNSLSKGVSLLIADLDSNPPVSQEEIDSENAAIDANYDAYSKEKELLEADDDESSIEIGEEDPIDAEYDKYKKEKKSSNKKEEKRLKKEEKKRLKEEKKRIKEEEKKLKKLKKKDKDNK